MLNLRSNLYKSNLIFLVVTIVLILGSIIAETMGMDYTALEIGYQYMFILVPCLIFIILTKKDFKQALRLNKVNLKQIGICVVLGFLIQPVANMIAGLTTTLIGDMAAQGAEMALEGGMPQRGLIFSLFLVALTPAICEEVLMRGVVLDGYRRIPLWKAALMNGILFGLFHNNLLQLTYAAFVGVILTYVVVYTNSIFPAMIMHFIMNGTSVIAEKFPGGTTAGILNLMESNYSICIIGGIIALILVILVLRILKKVSDYKQESYEKELKEISSEKAEVIFSEWPLMMAVAISVLYSL